MIGRVATREDKVILNTEIDDYLENRKNANIIDISEKNENDFVYHKNINWVILEDKTIKDRNKVKSTLYRLVFLNQDYDTRNLKATISKPKSNKLIKLNCFLPNYVIDKIKSCGIINFFNIPRIRSDLPFLKRDDGNFSIDFNSNY